MKNFKLKKRDLELMYYISTQSFAKASEIHSLFWTSKEASGSHYRRLSQLIKEGYIERLKGIEEWMGGYTITEKGQNLLGAYGYYIFPYVIKKDSYTGKYEHDILVHKIKNILLKSPLIENFIPEYQMAGRLLKDSSSKSRYKNKDKIPDGLFALSIENKPQLVALELELTIKSKRRYETIFSKHLLTKSWDTVFYVVKNEKMRAKLLGHMKEIKRKNFLLKTSKNLNEIYFALLDEVLTKELSSPFLDEEVEFSLKDFEKKAPKKIS